MKKNTKTIKALFKLTALTSILLFSSCMAQFSELEADPKLGFNGSFEFEKNGLPINWLVYTKNTVKEGDFDINFDRENPIDGNQSLMFKVQSCSADGGRFSPGIAQEVKAESGAEYLISVWVKNKESKVSINISGVDEFNKLQGPIIENTDTSEQWQEHKIQYTMPKNMKTLRIEITVLKPGTVYLDNIKINKV